MNPTSVGLLASAVTFGAALAGLWLRKVLPADHLDAESRDTIKLGIGFIATMSALVLGLITASAKNSFDSMDATVKGTAIQVLTLDRTLARYGTEAEPIRQALKKAIGARIQMVWPSSSSRPVELDPTHSGAVSLGEGLADAIRNLKPRDDLQRAFQSRAIELAEGLLQTRWLAMGGTEATVSTPFLVILMFWLTATFWSFGLLAPRKPIVVSVLLLCALSIGTALFLVLEMDGPFTGLLRVAPDPLEFAYAHMAQ